MDALSKVRIWTVRCWCVAQAISQSLKARISLPMRHRSCRTCACKQNLEELKEAPFHLANVLRVHLTAQHGQLCSGKVCLKGFPVIPLGLELLVTSFTPVQGELLNPNENAFRCSRKAVSKSCGKGGIFLVIRGLPHSRFTDVRNRRELLSESPPCTLHRAAPQSTFAA